MNGPLLGTLNFRSLFRKNYWALLGTYAFLATFSNTVSTPQESNCKSIHASVRPSVTFLVSVSPPKPLDVATSNFVDG